MTRLAPIKVVTSNAAVLANLGRAGRFQSPVDVRRDRKSPVRWRSACPPAVTWPVTLGLRLGRLGIRRPRSAAPGRQSATPERSSSLSRLRAGFPDGHDAFLLMKVPRTRLSNRPTKSFRLPAIVPSAHQVAGLIELLIALTDPSQKSKLATPGWRLPADIAPRSPNQAPDLATPRVWRHDMGVAGIDQ